jgi:hypothetical protein
MHAYKFLAAGGIGRFSNYEWPLPAGDAAGEWVEVDGPIADCVAGVHASRTRDLLDWIDDELWEIELDGTVEEREAFVIGVRGRLLHRIEGWTPEVAADLAADCAWQAIRLASGALERDGQQERADELAGAGELLDAQALAAASARSLHGPAATITAFAADAVALAHGRRPDAWDGSLADTVPQQTPAATAANLAFVVAHVAGLDAAAASGDEGAYERGFAAERERQLAWLVEKLGSAR